MNTLSLAPGFGKQINAEKLFSKIGRSLFLVAAFVVLVLCIASAAFAQTDAFVGVWKLNAAKSKFTSGPGRKSETRIVESSPTGLKVSVDRTYADGSNQQFNYTANLDGKSYPITGAAPFAADSISVKLSAPNTLSITLTKAGKVVATGTSVVSADGKTLTLTSKGTDENGKVVASSVVYDKQ